MLKLTDKIGFAPPAAIDRNRWSIDLDGVGDWLTSPTTPGGPPFSALVWVYFRAIPPNTAIVRWGPAANTDQFSFRVSQSGSGNIAVGNTNTGTSTRTASGVVSINTWYALGMAMTANQSDAAIYHQGVAQTVTPGSATTPAMGAGVSIGYGPGGGTAPGYTQPLNGMVATCALYPSRLQPADWMRLYNAGPGAPLIGFDRPIDSLPDRHWIMEEGAGAFTDDEVEAPATANRMAFNGDPQWSALVP